MFLEKYNFNDHRETYSDDSHNVDSHEQYSNDSNKENVDVKIETKKIECINLFLEKRKTIW